MQNTLKTSKTYINKNVKKTSKKTVCHASFSNFFKNSGEIFKILKTGNKISIFNTGKY